MMHTGKISLEWVYNKNIALIPKETIKLLLIVINN